MDRKLDKRIYRFILLCCLLASCSRLKQWSYQGIDRDQWQQPDKVIAALQIPAGAQIADLGAGGGYFTFYLAKAAGPSGLVYAVDIDKGTNELIAKQAKKDGVDNVKTILATAEDPLLPDSGVDLIFTSNTYHHIDGRRCYLETMKRSLAWPPDNLSKSWTIARICACTPGRSPGTLGRRAGV